MWPDVLHEFLGRYSVDADRLYEALTRHGLHGVENLPHGTILCRKGDAAHCFWLVVEGQVDVYENTHAPIRKRGRGDLLGEMAFLMARTPCRIAPNGQSPGRTAGLVAHGPVQVLRFDAALIDKFTAEERALWHELVAHVVNDKLVQATEQRAAQANEVADRNRLLSRFCDKTALGAVEARLSDKPEFSIRDVVVWFSDIAGFSTWSHNKAPAVVATAIKTLIGLQTELIRRYGGEIDKYMGDGLMAYWFCDGHHRSGVPAQVYQCAQDVIRAFEKAAAEMGLGDLTLRIGLHTGPACFGDFGTEDRIAVTLLGETINLGSRYEQVRADPELYPDLGPIRVSPELHTLICADGSVNGLNGPINAKREARQYRRLLG